MNRDFILSGKAIIEVLPSPEFIRERGTKASYVYLIKFHPGRVGRGCFFEPERYFVRLLRDPRDAFHYDYIGYFNPYIGDTVPAIGGKYSVDSWEYRIAKRILARIWAGEIEKIRESGWKVREVGSL